MRPRLRMPLVIAFAISLAMPPSATPAKPTQNKKKHEKPLQEKEVWNYDGGIYFQSDGDLPGGPCFRISGRVIANDFFQDLKRINFDEAPSVFRRGKETVTEFPEQMRLEFTIRDFPCSLKVDQPATRGYLTRPEIETLTVSLYWKQGIELRSVEQVALPQRFVHAKPKTEYVATEDLPDKYEWFYVYDVASTGIPVTDSLVVVLRTPAGNIAARVAARM
jgi:hypothetical protein